MPCYKTGAHVGQALESVDSQTCADSKVLVVDDRSPDDGPRDASIAFADQ
jgi:glycosyltransferase involved in cell wall biosynthesis